MPRLPRGKVQVSVYLDEEVAEALRKHVIAKYGKVRYLSREVEEAVRAWIRASPSSGELRAERDRAPSTSRGDTLHRAHSCGQERDRAPPFMSKEEIRDLAKRIADKIVEGLKRTLESERKGRQVA
jgi:hypothetical protein